MNEQEYIDEQVARLTAGGMEESVARVVASVTWNFIKWQYE